MSVLQIIAISISVLASVSGILAILWAAARVKGIELSLNLISTANDELRSEISDAKKALEDERHECAKRIGKLEGELEALMGGVGEKIIETIVHAMQSRSPSSRTRETDK